MTPFFPREPRPSIFQLSHPTLFFSFPWYPLSPNSQSVSAHIHHQLQGGVPVFGGLTPGAALIVHGTFFRRDSPQRRLQPQLQSPPIPPSDPTLRRFLPTGTLLRRSLSKWAPAGGKALQDKRSGSEFSGPVAGVPSSLPRASAIPWISGKGF